MVCLRDFKRLKFKSYRYFRDAVMTYPDDQIQYLAVRDGDDAEQLKALSVFNLRLNELIRPRQDTLDQLLGQSVDNLLRNEKKEAVNKV